MSTKKYKQIGQSGGLVRISGKGESTQKEQVRNFGDNKVIEPEYSFTDLIVIYETNNTARKCIELYAKNVVAAGWDIVPDDPDSANEKERDELIDFFRNCSPEHTFEYVVKEMVIDLKSAGNSGLEIARSRLTQKPRRIYNIPIDTLRIAKGGKDKGFKTGQRFIQNEEYNLNSDADLVWFNRYYPNPEDRTADNGFDPDLNGEGMVTNEVMFFKEPNPRDVHYGQSPSVTLLRNYLMTKYAEEYNIGEFENGMLQKFIVTVKNGSLSEDSIASLKEFMQEVLKEKEWSSVPVLNVTGQDAQVQIDKLGLENKEGSYLELLKFNREEVYIAFGVPPILLGIVEYSALANQNAQERKFHEKEIKPLQNDIAYRFTRMIKEDFGYDNWSFEWRTPDLRDMTLENEIASRGVEDGSLSINEKREILGLDPLFEEDGKTRMKGAEIHIVHTQHGLIPVNDLHKLSSEEYTTKVGEEQGKAIVSSLLNLRNQVVSEKQKKKIAKGMDDPANAPEGEYPKV